MRHMPVLDADSLTDSFIRRILEGIRRGELMPGDVLPSHHQLAAQYGVGLSTVREAIKALAMIDVVDVRPGRGTRVLPNALGVLNNMASVQASVRTVKFDQAYEARAAIEVLLARLAAQRATPQDLAEMRQAYGEMQACVEDTEAFLRADWRFHLAVAEAAMNVILAQMYTLAHGILHQMFQRTVIRPGGKEAGISYQGALLEAIAARDPERAEHCVRQHMDCFWTDWSAAAELLTQADPGPILSTPATRAPQFADTEGR
jgi:DNA-binding FadR family transcriptional regulator